MLDGVDTYFSQEAWDQGAYSLMSANPSKRIHENMVLPGEGRAREALATKLNDVPSMKAVNLAASSNGGSINTEQKSSSSVNSHKAMPMAQQDYNKRAADMRQELDTLMQRIRFSNLSEKEKQEAISILGDIGAVGATDMNLNILNQIRQQGLERFFRMLPESSRRQVIVQNKQQIRMDLMEELDEVKEEISQIPIWEKIPFMLSERYGTALEREQALQEKIQNVENALDKVFPEWENVMEIGGIGPVATLRPSPTPTPTPKPTPTPSPTSTPISTSAPTPNNPISGTSALDKPEDLPKEKVEAILKASRERLGIEYNKMQCNKLAYEAYAAAGIDIKGSAADQARQCKENGWFISKEYLMPGDLIFWTMPNCEKPGCHRWNEIHHVGIYIGDGKIIDSSTTRDAVVERKLWEGAGYEIFGYARPR